MHVTEMNVNISRLSNQRNFGYSALGEGGERENQVVPGKSFIGVAFHPNPIRNLNRLHYLI